MNDTVHTDPVSEAVHLGEEVSGAPPSFVRVLGENIPRKLRDVQSTVSSVVSSLKDIEFSMKRPPSHGFNHPKTEVKFTEVLEQILDTFPQLLHVVKEYRDLMSPSESYGRRRG